MPSTTRPKGYSHRDYIRTEVASLYPYFARLDAEEEWGSHPILKSKFCNDIYWQVRPELMRLLETVPQHRRQKYNEMPRSCSSMRKETARAGEMLDWIEYFRNRKERQIRDTDGLPVISAPGSEAQSQFPLEELRKLDKFCIWEVEKELRHDIQVWKQECVEDNSRFRSQINVLWSWEEAGFEMSLAIDQGNFDHDEEGEGEGEGRTPEPSPPSSPVSRQVISLPRTISSEEMFEDSFTSALDCVPDHVIDQITQDHRRRLPLRRELPDPRTLPNPWEFPSKDDRITQRASRLPTYGPIGGPVVPRPARSQHEGHSRHFPGFSASWRAPGIGISTFVREEDDEVSKTRMTILPNRRSLESRPYSSNREQIIRGSAR